MDRYFNLRLPMIRRSTIVLLRIPFSVFLMPVYFFALSQAPGVDSGRALLIFFILHLFLYPASNGYNSYMDRDEESIGMLEHPPAATRQLYYVSLFLDASALALSLLVSPLFAGCILLSILASRAYSYRGIRLKQYPLTGFLTVILIQGALTYFMVYAGASGPAVPFPWQGMLISALLFGAFYPLTQIYQHRQDLSDGVRTISYVLGYQGTFLFSAILFLLAELLFFWYFREQGLGTRFLILQLFFLPVAAYFLFWWKKVSDDRANANFRYSMRMNMIGALFTNLGFLCLLYLDKGG